MEWLRRHAALLGASLLGACGSAAALWAGYLAVDNRLSFGWDAAHRTVQNLDAAGALSRFDLPRLFQLVALQDHWPTLRLVCAAPLQLIFGPSLAVESALTIAHYAALLPVLAVAAILLLRERREAAQAFAIAALGLLANRALLGFATTAMLEVLSALTVLAATVAWLALREPGARQRIWPLALLGNLVLHTKIQYGVIFAAVVLATEAATLGADERRAAARALLAAARASLRHATLYLFALVALGCAVLAWLASRGDGFVAHLGGLAISMRRPHGAIFWAAFAGFWGLQVELWRARSTLAPAVSWRLRAIWAWMLVPMVAWILVPFSWRLRTLMVSGDYNSFADLRPGLLGRLAYYPATMIDWYSPLAAVAVGAGLALSLACAFKDEAVRRRLVPLGAIVVGQLLMLSASTRTNFVPRFTLDLAPLVALAAVLWVPALPRRWSSLAALAIGLALAVAVGLEWRPPRLVEALRPGFADAEVQRTCAPIGAGLRLGPEVMLANALPDRLREDCALSVALAARAQGAVFDVGRESVRATTREVVFLSPGCDQPPAVPLDGFAPQGEPIASGPVCARLWRRR